MIWLHICTQKIKQTRSHYRFSTYLTVKIGGGHEASLLLEAPLNRLGSINFAWKNMRHLDYMSLSRCMIIVHVGLAGTAFHCARRRRWFWRISMWWLSIRFASKSCWTSRAWRPIISAHLRCFAVWIWGMWLRSMFSSVSTGWASLVWMWTWMRVMSLRLNK